MGKPDDIADQFRQRLRTDEFPVGTTLPAVWTIERDYHVGSSTAYRAVKLLEQSGDLRVTHGSASEVLPEPPTPVAAPPPTPAEAIRSIRKHLRDAEHGLDNLAANLNRPHD